MLRCAIRRGASELNHDDPSSFSPPAAFGPFRVLHQIGSGVLGPVFRTYEPERDRLIAVKAFRIDLLPEQASLLGVELQRIVDAGLTNPGIVQPVAAGMEGHLPFLAQEYVAAESLDIAMKHYAPALPARVMPFLRQIAGAIDAGAASGILHGALHPRDVFLTTDEARTTGFGIVQAIENIGFRAPTRRPYTAPERVNGEEWGIEADVFSLGALAHELLTGRRPAGPGDQDGSFAADVPAEYRARLRDVLARALAEAPAARYSSATAFIDALDGAAQGQRVEAAPAGAASTRAAAAAATGVVAAPSLFDAGADDEVPSRMDEPVETIADVEDTTDVEDVRDVEDEDDIEDTSDVEDTEPDEPAAPDDAAEPDVWPPPGFSTDDVDITSEKETDEALGDFDLDLNRADPIVAAPIVDPSALDEATAAEEAEAFEYETSAEQDEAEPSIGRDAGLAVAAAPLAAPRVESWRPSSAAPPPSFSGPRTLLLLAGGLAFGLLIGWLIFGRGGTPDPLPQQVQETDAPASAAPETPATEVPVPPPAAPADAPSTPATDARPARPSSGSVLVRSTPANAMVVIDGVWTGRTPLTKRGMSFGAHTVRVVLEGYVPVNLRVTITPENASREVTFELQPVRGRGAPQPAASAGARVLVDGRFAGTTPVKLAGVTPGAHHVRIELDGHAPWSRTVDVTRNQDARVAASLQQR